MIRKALTHHRRHGQRGAAAIEFALLFLLFFSVLYAIVSYAMAMLLIQSFNHAAAEGARAAVRVNPLSFKSQAAYQSAVTQLATQASRKSLEWLPGLARTRINQDGSVRVGFSTVQATVPLGTGKSNLVTATAIRVDVVYTDYAAQPLVPFLTIAGIGRIPALPDDLIGSASLQL